MIKELDAKKISTVFYNRVSTMTNGVPGFSYPTVTLTVDAFVFEGTAAESMVSEKLRTDIKAVVLFDYSDYSATVETSAKCIINSKEYSVIHVENIANQNEVIKVPLKEFT